MLMLLLFKRAAHQSLARLTTANSVIISSQEGAGKSAVVNTLRSVAAAFLPTDLCAIYIHVRDCLSAFT